MLIKCAKCGKPLLEKFDGFDRNDKPIRWYRCTGGHWLSIPIAEKSKK